jgi:hypothetical protein
MAQPEDVGKGSVIPGRAFSREPGISRFSGVQVRSSMLIADYGDDAKALGVA